MKMLTGHTCIGDAIDNSLKFHLRIFFSKLKRVILSNRQNGKLLISKLHTHTHNHLLETVSYAMTLGSSVGSPVFRPVC